MLFRFLKYVSPVWYFNLESKGENIYFPDKEHLSSQGIDLEIDQKFETSTAQQRDLGYRAFQYGYIDCAGVRVKGQYANEGVSINDEYRFIRKHFNSGWSIYILLIRLFSLKNPIKEVHAFVKSRHTKREYYHQSLIQKHGYKEFESELIKKNPFVSVIIPTLNRYKYLKDVFRDLEKQTYTNFEVIAVDQTDPFDESVYEGWKLNLKFWYQEEKALWKARNEAIEAAKGEYILLYDDDSLVDEDWIEQHLKALDFYNADLSSGVSISTVGAKVPEHYAYFRWSDQLDTGNVLFKKSIIKTIGAFDTKFEKQRMGDGEYGLRAYLAGFRNISNPFAKRIHLKVGQGGLRQMGSWDGWRPKKFFGPRPVPSILYLFRKYFGNKMTGYVILKTLPLSLVPYQWKGNKLMMLLALCLHLFIFPIVIWQLWVSWRYSSQMLKK